MRWTLVGHLIFLAVCIAWTLRVLYAIKTTDSAPEFKIGWLVLPLGCTLAGVYGLRAYLRRK